MDGNLVFEILEFGKGRSELKIPSFDLQPEESQWETFVDGATYNFTEDGGPQECAVTKSLLFGTKSSLDSLFQNSDEFRALNLLQLQAAGWVINRIHISASEWRADWPEQSVGTASLDSSSKENTGGFLQLLTGRKDD